ncbi:G-protein gamma-like domain-containing protein [Spinellus fusiger]|nr:G-protein gamma-like domain-containing protein [Spinellus fusiger]
MPLKRAQNIAEAKLNRLLELNKRLKEQLDVPRITVSSASSSLIEYCKTTKDPMIPSLWGSIDKKEDPFAPAAGGGCCAVM